MTVAGLDAAQQAVAQQSLSPRPADGPLFLRTVGALDDGWDALGFASLISPYEAGAAVELVCPLPIALATVEDTRALGRRLAAALRPGDLVVLAGPLGAGKTALAQGIGAGLGVTGAVTSPTYVLARRHAGPVPLLHVDVYRLAGNGPVELDDLDLDVALDEAVTVVEWGQGVVEGLSPDRLQVTLARAASDEQRTAWVRPHGTRWRAAAALSHPTPRVE